MLLLLFFLPISQIHLLFFLYLDLPNFSSISFSPPMSDSSSVLFDPVCLIPLLLLFLPPLCLIPLPLFFLPFCLIQLHFTFLSPSVFFIFQFSFFFPSVLFPFRFSSLPICLIHIPLPLSRPLSDSSIG